MDINQAFPGLNIVKGTSVKQMLARLTKTRINYNSELLIFSDSRMNGVITDHKLEIVGFPCKPLVVKSEIPDAPCNIYHAEDGTTVMLYCWTDGWHMATRTCLDVADFVMPGTSMTYRDALMQVLSEDVPKFDITALDTSLSYTIGFHHPDFHPFDRVHRRVWLIGAYNRAGIRQTVKIGVPEQKPIKITHETAIENCVKSIDHYLASAAQPDNRSPPRLGYIFEYADHRVFYPSALYQAIESHAYDNLSPAELRTGLERYKYIAFRAATASRVCPGSTEMFTQLFPRLAPVYNEAKSRIANYESRSELSVDNFATHYFAIWGYPSVPKSEVEAEVVVDNFIKAALE